MHGRMGDTLAVALPGGAEWAEAHGNGLAEAVQGGSNCVAEAELGDHVAEAVQGGSNCVAEAELGDHVAEAEPGDLVSVYLAADAQDG